MASYLTAWLDGKRNALKPKSLYRYSEIITKELAPALGALSLEQLRRDHVAALVTELEEAGQTPRRSDVAGRLMFTAPKTKGSAANVGLSARVVAALKRQAAAWSWSGPNGPRRTRTTS
ncbi:MAG: hypothetical protein ACRDTC_18995 [Pseudonocardiaceae bacterium]